MDAVSGNGYANLGAVFELVFFSDCWPTGLSTPSGQSG